MRLLLDSHAVVWAVDQPQKLGSAATAAISDSANELLIGAGTIWELAIKAGLGKLALSLPYVDWMSQVVRDLDLTLLPITVEHAATQAGLPLHHRDPFDRLLTAQAMVENVAIVTIDPAFDSYAVSRIW